MTPENQRYFGDWVSFDGYGDVGYYLGTDLVRYLLKEESFEKGGRGRGGRGRNARGGRGYKGSRENRRKFDQTDENGQGTNTEE